MLFQADLGAGAYSPEIEADSNKLISGEVQALPLAQPLHVQHPHRTLLRCRAAMA